MQASEAVAEVGIDTVACVGQDDSRRDAGGQSSADLPECDLWFGLEPDGLGDPSLTASNGSFARLLADTVDRQLAGSHVCWRSIG